MCHLCVSMWTCVGSYPRNSEEDIGSLGAGMSGGGTPPILGTGNGAQILCCCSLGISLVPRPPTHTHTKFIAINWRTSFIKFYSMLMIKFSKKVRIQYGLKLELQNYTSTDLVFHDKQKRNKSSPPKRVLRESQSLFINTLNACIKSLHSSFKLVRDEECGVCLR